MSSTITLPNKKCAIFWPVGTGDSTTLVLKPGAVYIQVDLHHLEKAEDEAEPEWPVIDELIKLLPKDANDHPYLDAFVLTHPDQDHVRGFAELLRRVHIGELWHTPKIFRDQSDQDTLCDDAKAFRKEAHRRRKVISDNPYVIASGDRLRVIGHDDILLEDEYKNLPDSCKSRPGDKVTVVNGVNHYRDFQAFIHAPFSDDQAKDKNNTSLSLNVVIFEGDKYGQFFFFGDREYPTIKRIFETTEANPQNVPYLYWDVMLCAHHCSKKVMYWQDEGDSDEVDKSDIMDYFAKYNRGLNGHIIASSHSKFTDGDGDNPPHKKARKKYEGIVKSGQFLCTHEFNKADPVPIVFTVDASGVKFVTELPKSADPGGLAAAALLARPGSKPPTTQVGFGRPAQ